MTALKAIREEKLLKGSAGWAQGKMPRNAFPLSRSHGYALGSGWEWSVYKLTGPSGNFRLLIAFEPRRAQYQAWLGLEDKGDQALLARLEYHPSHKGWHCHVKKGALEAVSRGVVRVPSHRERSVTCQDQPPFYAKQADAIAMAFKLFNVNAAVSKGLL